MVDMGGLCCGRTSGRDERNDVETEAGRGRYRMSRSRRARRLRISWRKGVEVPFVVRRDDCGAQGGHKNGSWRLTGRMTGRMTQKTGRVWICLHCTKQEGECGGVFGVVMSNMSCIMEK